MSAARMQMACTMIALFLTVVAAPQLAASEGRHVVVVDLGTLEPGITHRIGVPAGRSLLVRVVNRRPGSRYRLQGGSNAGGGSGSELKAIDLEQHIWGLRPRKACADVVAAADAMFAADDETAVARQTAPGGLIDRVTGFDHCPDDPTFVSQLRWFTHGEVGLAGPAAGETFVLTIDRMPPGELTGQPRKGAAPGEGRTALRTWRIELDTQASKQQWAHANEETWILDSIARDIAEMALLAGSGTLPESGVRIDVEKGQEGRGRYSLRLAGDPSRKAVVHGVVVDPWVWSPRLWESFATVMTRTLGVRGSARLVVRGTPLASLTDPRSETLERENRRISNWLAADTRDPMAHEQAALLLGALGLAEAAGPFSDTRATLCRLTAHLAFARSLRAGSPPSREGVFAELTLLTLVGRQRDALAALATVGAPTPAERAWINAIRLRITADWRLLSAPSTATLLERREHYRALATSLGGLHAVDFLRKRDSERIPDWGRIALGMDFSVEEGAMFADAALALELAELGALRSPGKSQVKSAAALVAAMNERPSLCIVREAGGRVLPRVISSRSWGAYYLRHVAAAATHADYYRRRMLGDTRTADEHWRRVQAALSGLEALPLIAAQVARNGARSRIEIGRSLSAAARAELCASAQPFWQLRPAELTPLNWNVLLYLCDGIATVPVRSYERWFEDQVPRGTALDAGARLSALGGAGDLPLLERLRGLAPYQKDIAHFYVARRYMDRATLAEFDEGHGSRVDYDLDVMKQRAALVPDDAGVARGLLERICALDQDSCLALGAYLAGQGLDEQAATAFQRSVDEGLDRVTVSNNVRWLVDYYEDHGQQERAQDVARMERITNRELDRRRGPDGGW